MSNALDFNFYSKYLLPADVNPDDIRGNMPAELKKTILHMLFFHVSNNGKVFNSAINSRLRFVECNMTGQEGNHIFETVAEITVEDDMLNAAGDLSGTCAVCLMEFISIAALVFQGLVQARDATGSLLSLHTAWHSPVKNGTRLRLVGTSNSLGRRVGSAKCEMFDKETGKLLVTATHVLSTHSNTSHPSKKAKL